MRDAIGYVMFLTVMGVAALVIVGICGCEAPTEYIAGPAPDTPECPEASIIWDKLYTVTIDRSSNVYWVSIYSNQEIRIELVAGDARDFLLGKVSLDYDPIPATDEPEAPNDAQDQLTD